MTDKIQTLYYIKDLRDNNIIYVGETKNFEQRKYFHFKDNRSYIDLYMFEQGRDNFKMLPFTDDDYSIKSDEELLKAEDKKILELQPIMNKKRSGLIEKNDPEKYNREYQKSEKRRKYQREYQKSEKWKEYRREYRKQRKAKLIENI